MIRIRTITLSTASLSDARRAMRASCAPFGSLSDEIADLALAYVAGPHGYGFGADAMPRHGGCTVEAGIALLRAVRAMAPDALETELTASGEWSEVLLGGGRVQLITPTSGTVIELRRTSGRSLVVTVDFGENGSDRRADQILEHDTAAPDLAWEVTPVGSVATE